MKMKYYAVHRGRNPGVYTDWEEAKAQVNGYSNNLHMSFDTYNEAQHFSRFGYAGNTQQTTNFGSYGMSSDDVNTLLSYGVKPWEDEAFQFLGELKRYN
jgi:viroplasmin and RNaseH domain-containing protein